MERSCQLFFLLDFLKSSLLIFNLWSIFSANTHTLPLSLSLGISFSCEFLCVVEEGCIVCFFGPISADCLAAVCWVRIASRKLLYSPLVSVLLLCFLAPDMIRAMAFFPNPMTAWITYVSVTHRSDLQSLLCDWECIAHKRSTLWCGCTTHMLERKPVLSWCLQMEMEKFIRVLCLHLSDVTQLSSTDDLREELKILWYAQFPVNVLCCPCCARPGA